MARLAAAAPAEALAEPEADVAPEAVVLDVPVLPVVLDVAKAVELTYEATLPTAAVVLPTGAVTTGETTGETAYDGDVAAPPVVTPGLVVADTDRAEAADGAETADRAEVAAVGAWSWPSVYWLMGAWGTATAPRAATMAKAIEARILTMENDD